MDEPVDPDVLTPEDPELAQPDHDDSLNPGIAPSDEK